ncbi:MAG TPA: hypothetical protein VKR52_14590 [Terracidiphilus sp.]|nr:hypothetical protein [Terracidiphilus sp.]
MSSSADQNDKPALPGWLKVGVVAAASAFAGGMAAAWFYRKTLTRLRQEAEREPQSNPSDDSADEI